MPLWSLHRKKLCPDSCQQPGESVNINISAEQGSFRFGCTYTPSIGRQALGGGVAGCSPLCNITLTVNTHQSLHAIIPLRAGERSGKRVSLFRLRRVVKASSEQTAVPARADTRVPALDTDRSDQPGPRDVKRERAGSGSCDAGVLCFSVGTASLGTGRVAATPTSEVLAVSTARPPANTDQTVTKVGVAAPPVVAV